MTTKHSSESWTLFPCKGGGILFRGKDHPQSHLQVVPFEDAALMAAAPDLRSVLDRLARAAEHRENTQGDPIRLLEVQAELRDAAFAARLVLLATRGRA